MGDNVNFKVTAENEASRVVKKVVKDLKKLQDTYNKNTAGVKKWAKDNEKSFTKMRNVGVVSLGVISAAVVSFSKKASQFEEVEGAFHRLTKTFGSDADEILKSLRSASKGAISDYDLILSANRAMALGVATNTEEFTTLMEIARVKAKSMGITTQQAYNDIVTGLGRASPLILDNLGIVVKLGDAQERYAKVLGKTVAEMTEAEKKQSLINAVVSDGKKELEEMGEITLTNAERRQVARAAIDNTMVSLGKAFLPMVETILPAISALTDRIGEFAEANPELVKNLTIFAAVAAGLVLVLGTLGLAIVPIITGIGFLISPIGILIVAVTALGLARATNFGGIREKTKALFDWLGSAFRAIGDFISNTWRSVFGEATEGTGKFIAAMRTSIGILTSIFGGTFKAALIFLRLLFQVTFESIKLVVKTAISVIINTIKVVVDTFKGLISFFRNVFTGNRKAAREDIKGIFSSWVNRWKNIFGELLVNAGVRGKNLLLMFRDGLLEGAAAVGDAIKGVAQKIKNFLGFSSPTKEGPGSDADKRAPNFMQMFSDGMIKNYSLVENASKGAADKVKLGFEELRSAVNEELNRLNSDFKEKTIDLKKQAGDLLKEINNLNKAFAGETADDEKTLAEEFVNTRTNIKTMEESLHQKKLEQSRDISTERRNALQQEVNDLVDKIQIEKEGLQSSAGLEIELSDQIAEVNRRNGLSELQRQVEDFNFRRNQRQAEFLEKKKILFQEGFDVIQQQKVLKKEYIDSRKLINEQYQLSFDFYTNAINSSEALTKARTDAMVSHFKNVSAAIREVSAAQSMAGFNPGGAAIQATMASASIPGFANGGIVNKPTMAMIGEGKHSEAVVPMPGGKGIPVDMKGGGSGGLVININGPIQGFDAETAEEIMNIGVQEFQRKNQFELF